jgi:hypothetical protein
LRIQELELGIASKITIFEPKAEFGAFLGVRRRGRVGVRASSVPLEMT